MAASATNGGPPASTLAAQLVDDISVSARASKSDENSELRRLFAIVQRVIDNPALLGSPQERVEHNHMLIYVYCRTVLTGINLDGPDLDKAHTRHETLKAINFLRFTIKETPSVLAFNKADQGLLFRGNEPLWVWLLPQVLRFLCHPQCDELESSIDGFLQYMLMVIGQHGVLWECMSPMLVYLQNIVKGLQHGLKLAGPRISKDRIAREIILPPPGSLDQVLGHDVPFKDFQSYKVTKASQALAQCMGICKIISTSMNATDSQMINVAAAISGTWLLDCLLDLQQVQKGFRPDSRISVASMIELSTEVLKNAPTSNLEFTAVRRKACTLLILLAHEILTLPSEASDLEQPGSPMRYWFCVALIWIAHIARNVPSIGHLAVGKLADQSVLHSQYPALSPSTDLWKSAKLLNRIAQGGHSVGFEDEDSPDWNMEDERLLNLVEALELSPRPIPDQVRSAKRRKTLGTGDQTIIERVQELLGLTHIDNSSAEHPLGSEDDLCSKLSDIPEDQQCLVIELLTSSGCVGNSSLKNLSKTSCSTCDQGIAETASEPNMLYEAAIITLTKMVGFPWFQQSRRGRVAAMIGLKRIINHCREPVHLNIGASGLGQWCLQSLSSSTRELRVAAGRALAAFLRVSRNAGHDQETFQQNVTTSITLLKKVSEKGQSELVETCVLAWGQLGRVVLEQELGLVLLKLSEYLGSRNDLVSAFAFDQLLKLAEAREMTPRRMFDPYWRHLAFSITQNMTSNPQASRAVADLLQVSVNELLLMIQSHAIPWLVLHEKKDVIRKFADARQENELWQPLMHSTNIASTLGLLFMQDVEDTEVFAKKKLDSISPHFEPLTVLSLLQSEPVLVSMELLKAAGDSDAKGQESARRGLEKMAVMIMSPGGLRKKDNVVGRFLHAYILGLMARLTDVINDTAPNPSPALEQRRCIGAIEEMIKVCAEYAMIARPQISACLLAALNQDALREAALSCWATMLAHFVKADSETLLETTFYIVKHYWPILSTKSSAIVRQMLDNYHRRHVTILENKISRLPRLDDLDGLEDFEAKLQVLRPLLLTEEVLIIFAERVCHENSGVVHLALQELASVLLENQSALCSTSVGARSGTAVSSLLRALLDCASKYHETHIDIASLCTECMGLIGCLDSNQIQIDREQRSIVVLGNFSDQEETIEFALFVIAEVLVPSFLSATDTKLQGFLSYAMQELLERTNVSAACAGLGQGTITDSDNIYRKWLAMPKATREIVTPFLTSRYRVFPMPAVIVDYPIFRPGKSYSTWLRSIVFELLNQGQSHFAELIFEPLTRVIRVKDLAATEFLLPYLVLHVLLGTKSSAEDQERLEQECFAIFAYQPAENCTHQAMEDSKRYYQAIFRVLDYAMRWIQSKRSQGRLTPAEKTQLTRIQGFLDRMPAEAISQRAVSCNEYARALFHLEQYTQRVEQVKANPDDRQRLMDQLQFIYASIDEPDGLEGMSANLEVLDIQQQMLGHKKAGRWAAVQTWYEMELAEQPDNVNLQLDLLDCLRQSGQHDVLLNYAERYLSSIRPDEAYKIMPLAAEASWLTNRWQNLTRGSVMTTSPSRDFNVCLGAVLGLMKEFPMNRDAVLKSIGNMRAQLGSEMSHATTSSLQSAHDLLLKCHVLTDLEMIVETPPGDPNNKRQSTLDLLSRRTEVIGAYISDKQYLLGIQRAALDVTGDPFQEFDVSNLWLASARLARKTTSLHQPFSSILHAAAVGDDAAAIENAKLLWRDNHRRQAIQMLQGAIERNRFMTQSNWSRTTESTSAGNSNMDPHGRLLTARAQLLLAKWLDAAGQTHASALRERYQQPPKTFPSWEKGHYYLGRHYKKILDAERHLKPDDQGDSYVTGEVSRLVVENYLRSLNAGTKYLYQTLPRILTLWLEMGSQTDRSPESGRTSVSNVSKELWKRRLDQLTKLHDFLDKYIKRLPAYIFYTALPQIVARITHQNATVFNLLTRIICKVVEAYPRQALWSLIGMATSKQNADRRARGVQILGALRKTTAKTKGHGYDLRALLRSGESLAEQLLLACHNGEFTGNKTLRASLRSDLRFNHNCTPCPLVVPVESELTPTLPVMSTDIKLHQAFSENVVSIESFLDDVLVLSSLARPRRLEARGSDGKIYKLLIKPKDDLRTDQRLMEFNGMINRSLKRDAESSRRQLYIRTYAVVPLNEECGIIEWVPGIKTMRDILLGLYAAHKIHPDYVALRHLMDEASRSDSKTTIFTDDVLGRFPPLLPTWFIQQFPNPSAWFAARLRYTRSCAVMSMVGTILGLGDRHGENVNLEEGTGGIFHVDFNCLFDKGLTFAKPEKVPFRLTHNMVAAMGIYGYEGPFRKCSELTLSILRQHEETLMSILEAFIYDPTLDLQKDKRAAKREGGVKLQPQSVVNSIKRKVQGLLPSETIPLGVEGQVEELIKQAVDPKNLTAMYIGWCPFL